MLGVVVVADDGEFFSAEALFEPFLGVPLLARAIGAMLPPDETCSVHVVLPEDLHERARHDVKDRFGLDEIDAFLPTSGSLAQDIRDAVAAFPEDIDFIALTTGTDILAPAGLVQRVLEGARRGRLAAASKKLPSLVVADDDGQATHVESAAHLREVCAPLVMMREEADAVLAADDGAWLQHAVQGDTPVTLVDGDDDHFVLRTEDDLTRAVEVFHRRAVDYAFLYPKDLLPDDPLKKILDENEARLAQQVADAEAAAAADDADHADGDDDTEGGNEAAESGA